MAVQVLQISSFQDMATVSTSAHGVRVETHIIPLETAETPEKKESKDEPSTPSMTRMFLRGEPKALGTVQVFTGLLLMALGTISLVADTLRGDVTLGLGISCVICGSFTLAARKGTCLRLIIISLALNIIGSLLALSGICYFSYTLAITSDVDMCSSSRYYFCKRMAWQLRALLSGLKIWLLLLSISELFVCTILIAFSCVACHQTSAAKVVVEVQTSFPVYQSGHEPLLQGEDVDAIDHPPAYKP